MAHFEANPQSISSKYFKRYQKSFYQIKKNVQILLKIQINILITIVIHKNATLSNMIFFYNFCNCQNSNIEHLINMSYVSISKHLLIKIV